jgi:hypothetical protein
MCRWVNWALFLSYHWIHAKIHLIVNNIFFNTSCIYKSLLVLNLSVIYLEADEHSIVASSFEGNNVAAYCVSLMGLSWGKNRKFVLMSLKHVDKFLFLDCCNHKGLSSRITGNVLTCITKRLPGTIRLHPVFPKVYSWVLTNRFWC